MLHHRLLDAIVGLAAGAMIFWATFGAGVWVVRLLGP